MLMEWNDAPIGNNPGKVSQLAPRAPLGRVVVRAFAGRARRVRSLELPTAA